MRDLVIPDPKRVRKHLSAVINFAKFRTDRTDFYIDLVNKVRTNISTCTYEYIVVQILGSTCIGVNGSCMAQIYGIFNIIDCLFL